MFFLIATDGSNEWRFPAPTSDARLGSAADNDLVLPARGVSRHHAVIRPVRGGVEIVDQGSKNGLAVAGKRVERAILSPGLGLHIGVAWLEFQELSTTEETLSWMARGESALHGAASRITSDKSPAHLGDEPSSSPETALALAYHLHRAGAGRIGDRLALLAQSRAVLGAQTLVTAQRVGRIGLSVVEGSGSLAEAEARAICAAVKGKRSWSDSEIHLKSIDHVLVAGCMPWLLAAVFADPVIAAAPWRRDLMRILGEAFFSPIRSVRELTEAEVDRALELTSGNKARAARLLGLSRQSIYDHLRDRPSRNVKPEPPRR